MDQADSKSLWNYTLSPGWNYKEVKVLRQALCYFGIGKWKKIQELNCLPNKTISQIYMQTQRLLGQQSLGDFMGLKVRLHEVWEDNQKKEGVIRKFGCVINSGNNPSKEQRKLNIKQNDEKYGLTFKELAKIKKPYGYNKNIRQIMTIEEIENNSHKLSTLETIQELQYTKKEILKRLQLFQKNEEKKQSLNNSFDSQREQFENKDIISKKVNILDINNSQISTNQSDNNQNKNEIEDNKLITDDSSDEQQQDDKENVIDLSNFIYNKNNNRNSKIRQKTIPSIFQMKNKIQNKDKSNFIKIQNQYKIKEKNNINSHSDSEDSFKIKKKQKLEKGQNLQDSSISISNDNDIQSQKNISDDEDQEINSLSPDTESIEECNSSIQTIKNSVQ